MQPTKLFNGVEWVEVSPSVASSASFSTVAAISANVPIVFDEEQFDTVGAYDNTTGVFTVPAGAGGIYAVEGSMFTATASGGIYILHNNVNIGYITGFISTPSIPFSGTALVSCAAGDTLSIASDSAITVSGASGNISVRFQVSKIT